MCEASESVASRYTTAICNENRSDRFLNIIGNLEI